MTFYGEEAAKKAVYNTVVGVEIIKTLEDGMKEVRIEFEHERELVISKSRMGDLNIKFSAIKHQGE